MKNKQRTQHDEIGELLRRGDPAADDAGLGADETLRMRRRILSERPVGKAMFLRAIPALAAVAMIVVVAVVGWQTLRPDFAEPTQPTATTHDALPGETERRTRQVQFSTPGGTRIIWLLDSEFEV